MLSDAKARRLKPEDKPVSDGTITGLYLVPAGKVGTGKWILRFVSPVLRKRREMGLGSYPTTPIRDARIKALEARNLIEEGTDPLEERKAKEEALARLATIPTFEEAARRHHADRAEGFRSAKHRAQWITTLEAYVLPGIGSVRVDKLSPADFARCLRPIWLKKAETASRVKQRCDAVMCWAAANGFILASPVSVVDKLLPAQPSKRERVKHYPAVPWRDLPGFFSDLLYDGRTSQTRRALELLILTGTRSGEVRKMRWEEIDFAAGVWSIPPERTKTKVVHRVPLSVRIVELLDLQLASTGEQKGLVFRSRTGTPISDMTITKLLRHWKVASDTPGRIATAHGFRSSFRDWASESGYSRDLAERALSHSVKNAVEAAYHRTDLLEQRRLMMKAWEGYCLNRPTA